MYKTINYSLDTERTVTTAVQNTYINTNDADSVKIVCNLKQDGEPLDLTGATIKLAIRKPDKTIVFQNGTVDNILSGLASFVLETQSYVIPGAHVAEVMVYFDGGKVVVTRPFAYQVVQGILSDTAVESTSWYQDINELQTLVADLEIGLNEQINQAMIDATAEATLAADTANQRVVELTGFETEITSQLADTETQIVAANKILQSTKKTLHLSKVSGFFNGQTAYNAASFIQDNLTTHAGYQYGVFIGRNRAPYVGKRQLPDGEWSLFDLSTLPNNNLRTPTLLDGHNVYAIAVDKEGYIHIAGNMHGNNLNYIRSSFPENHTQWASTTPTGHMVDNTETQTTYPAFFKLSDGTLFFTYRDGTSVSGNLMLNVYNYTTRSWSRKVPVLIDGKTSGNNPYINHIAVDKNDVIHISCTFRMTGYNESIYYLKSADKGATWRKSDNTIYSLPTNKASLEMAKSITGAGNGLLNQNGMEVDKDGNPHITYFRKDSDNFTNIFHLYHSGTAWVERKVTSFKKLLPSDLVAWSGEMSRPSILCVGNRVFIIYRVNYTERNGTLRMLEVTPTLDQPIDFPILNIDLQCFDPTFDTQALYTRNELHMFVIPSQTDYQIEQNKYNLDNWSNQYGGVLSIDLNQIDKLIRHEVKLPEIKITKAFTMGEYATTTATGVITLPSPVIPFVDEEKVVFARLSLRGYALIDNKLEVYLKRTALDGSVSFANTNTIELTQSTGASRNYSTPFQPLPLVAGATRIGNALLQAEANLTMLNGGTVKNVKISTLMIELAEIVY